MHHSRTLAALLALVVASPSVANAKAPEASKAAEAAQPRDRLVIVQTKGDFVIRRDSSAPPSAGFSVRRMKIGSSVHIDRLIPLPSTASFEVQEIRHDPIQ